MRGHAFLGAFQLVLIVLIASIPSVAAAANETSLLTATELEGGALTPESAPKVRTRRVNSAMLAALVAEAQLRRIELILKSGPAQSGDLRVAQANHSARHSE
jgi:hypothetical protein